MPEWYETMCSFQKTGDGRYYQAVGKENEPVIIPASEIIKALQETTLNKNIKGIRIS